MFGYIKPFKPELKISEFELFKGVYCGLCKQQSKIFGSFSSLTLSYDFTFIALLSLAMSDECKGFSKCKCVANPLNKKNCLNSCDDLEFASALAMIMVYYKLRDNIADEKLLKRIPNYLILPFFKKARKKTLSSYSRLDEIVETCMSQQFALEKSEFTGVDRAADPTATALSLIFEELSEDTTQKKVLNRFGYLVGRFVYFIDALDDLESDMKTNSFNPFIKKFEHENASTQKIKDYAISTINLTIGDIPTAFELLEIKRYKPILDNIIYLGLHHEIKMTLDKTKKKHNRKEYLSSI